MPDYSKTKILSERMTMHRSDYNKWKKNNAHDRISSFDLFEEYGIKNCIIELLEATPCNSKGEKEKT